MLDQYEIEATLERAAVGAGMDRDAEAGGIRGVRATIKSGLNAGAKEPRVLPERVPVAKPVEKSKPTRATQTESPEAEPKPEEWEAPASFNEYHLPVFPVETLPAWLKVFVVGLARETQTPVDMAAMLTLAACSAAVAGNVKIEARPGWSEPLNPSPLSLSRRAIANQRSLLQSLNRSKASRLD